MHTGRQVAWFLRLTVPEDKWAAVTEQSSVQWMLRPEHLDKWDGPHTSGKRTRRRPQFRWDTADINSALWKLNR
jgi:hypothetical protein